MTDLVQVVCDALEVSSEAINVEGRGTLPSAYRVTDLAVASLAGAAAALRDLLGDEASTGIAVDRDLASHWFSVSIRPAGWQLPPLWDSVAGDYRATDGWIRLHTNAAHHRAAALHVLDASADRSVVAEAVRRWSADELERAVVEAGGAAAAMHTVDEWRTHVQGRAVADEPLIDHRLTGPAPGLQLPRAAGGRPLEGIRVLDLTRVLAGPVATRLLAGWGADVLRIDPPDWDEPGVIPEVMLGKRTARLDLRHDPDRQRFTDLLADADVLVHGYRSDALSRMGFDADTRQAIRPGLVDVALDAYGWSGPWATRRGFDSLVQMSVGIAAEGMRTYDRDRPTPLPVQALDHATGYLLAAAALRGVAQRHWSQRGSTSRLSLARTAKLLIDAGSDDPHAPPPSTTPAVDELIEQTSWGPARRLAAPVAVSGAPLRWDRPATMLGSDSAVW